jgi:hypothetical protein
MTDEENEKYGKRLYGIQEKGFKIRVERIGGGGSAMRTPLRRPVRTRTSAGVENRPADPRPQPPPPNTAKYPFLDERDEFGEKMLMTILKSDLAREVGGFTIGEFCEILEHNHIRIKSSEQVRTLVRRMYEGRRLAARREATKKRYFLKEEVRS